MNADEGDRQTASKSLKILFYAFEAIGHLNACAGLAQTLASRGHLVYFLLNESYAGQFAKFGFEEIVLKSTNRNAENDKSAKPENSIKKLAVELTKSGMLGPGTPLQKWKLSANALFGRLLSTAIELNPQIEQAIVRVKPDLVILDHFVVPPAVQKASIPWVYLCSGNPLRLYNYETDKLPPFGAGFSVRSDPSTWLEFLTFLRDEHLPKYAKLQSDLNEVFNFVSKHPVQSGKSFSLVSPYLNIYGFPKELDYSDTVEPSPKLVGLDAFCRVVSGTYELPKELLDKPGGKLIYVSLGSMGSIDLDLMKRIVSVLAAAAPHRFIISKGPRGEEYDLPDNCWGENFVPQTQILPLVELVITHGGNNTLTESLSFGKPVIVMPLFGDQFDNAQRVHEKRYGIRLEPYSFTQSELLQAIEQLLNDSELHQRLQKTKERMDKSNSKQLACQRIERIFEKF